MKAVKFNGVNRVIGENQPQYIPLPVQYLNDDEGTVISCWELTEEELQELMRTKRIYLQQLTFNSKLQPVRLTVDLSDNIELKYNPGDTPE